MEIQYFSFYFKFVSDFGLLSYLLQSSLYFYSSIIQNGLWVTHIYDACAQHLKGQHHVDEEGSKHIKTTEQC